MPSQRFTLNTTDLKNWLQNALIFLAPVLIMAIPSLEGAIPTDWKWAAVTLWALNVLLDLLRKFIAGK